MLDGSTFFLSVYQTAVPVLHWSVLCSILREGTLTPVQDLPFESQQGVLLRAVVYN